MPSPKTPSDGGVRGRACLDENELLAYCSGELSDADLMAIDEHLQTCSACLEVVRALNSKNATDVASAEASSSRRVQRALANYVILDELGAGGMGCVFVAYDKALDRRVALKLMNRQGRMGSARIRREAQAMARLSHPNVVTVYSVHALSDDDVAISMEYVQGRSLRDRLASKPRMGWATVRDIFTQAANGLAAAHDAGLVHRDFKPGNLLVDKGGRAKIIDFGLAYASDQPRTSSVGEDGEPRSEWTTSLTQTGSQIGTPAYMAPEQVSRGSVDSRTDQFAFCLCLFEAIYGQRAFPADTVESLKEKLSDGEWSLPPRPPDVPRSVETLLRRGLAVDPAARFASMRDVAVELERATASPPWYRSQRVAVSVVAALGTVALAVVLVARSAPTCAAPEDAFSDVWGPEAQTELRARFRSAGMGPDEGIWARVASRLEAFKSSWLALHVAVCEASQIRGEQTRFEHAVQSACLQEQKGQFQTLVHTLFAGSPEVLERAVDMVAGLSVRRCEDASSLLSMPLPEDSGLVDEVHQIRRKLNNLEIAYSAASYQEGLKTSRQLFKEAEATRYSPIIVEARYWNGRFLAAVQDYARAVDVFEETYGTALELRHFDVAADASREAAEVIGLYQGELENAHPWSVTAQALARLRDPGGLRDARALQVRGMLAALGGETEDAKRSLRKAEGLLRSYYRGAHPQTLRVTSNQGVACLAAGQFEEALQHFARSLALSSEVYGTRHKRLSRTYYNIGLTNYYRAREVHIRGELRRAKMSSPRDVEVGRVRGDSGTVNDGEDVVHLLNIAEQNLAQARGLVETGAGEGHDFVAGIVLAATASVELLRGQRRIAERRFDRSLEVLRRTLGDAHPFLSMAYLGLGDVALQADRLPDAIRYLEKSIEISGSGRNGLASVAMAEFLLARALLQDGKAGRAQTIAKRASDHFAKQGWSTDASYVQTWLRQVGLQKTAESDR